MKRLERWILHPFLLGVYPIIALMTHNISQIIPLYAVRSILFALVLTLLTLLFFRVILEDWRRAAMVASLAMLLFFIHGRIYPIIEDLTVLGVNIGRHRTLMGLWVVVLTIWSWLISKRSNIQVWTKWLNVVAVVAISLPLAQILYFEARKNIITLTRPPTELTAENLELSIPENQTPPDIYYIILDTYTRADSLQVNFGYDNTPFLDSLRREGFYIADCSQSNYQTTYSSLASSLNFNYLNILSDDLASPNARPEDVYPYVHHSAVRNVLEDLGYKVISFDSGESPTKWFDADIYLSPENNLRGALTIGGFNPFEVMVMQTSAALWFYDMSVNYPNIKVFMDYPYIIYRNQMVFTMNKLEDIPIIPGPKFVFAHILAPHNPFVFGPNGEEIISERPFTLNNDPFVDYKSGYRDELIYLNSRFEQIVETILSKSENPPIIIIQGDHGVPRKFDWNMVILNAYYLPGDGETNLYPSISPVNTFRVIFNKYFGGNLPLLEDYACESTDADPFNCLIKVDPSPQCTISP